MERFDETTGEIIEEADERALVNGVESKEQAFERLAAPRVTNVRRYLRLVGNLSNKGSYHYTKEQVDRIFASIREALADSEAAFRRAGPKQGDLFKL